MKALVVYKYEHYDCESNSYSTYIDNDVEYFAGDNPTLKEICDFEDAHERCPVGINRNVRVLHIIKLEE